MVNEIPPEWIEPITNAVSWLVDRIVDFLPKLFGAIIILLIGWVVAWIAEKITRRVLIRIELDKLIKRWKLEKAFFHISMTNALVLLVKFYVWVLFFAQAATTMELLVIADFLDAIIKWIPSWVVGGLIIVIGIAVGDFLNKRIQKIDIMFSELAGGLVYFIIIYFAIVLALPKFGFREIEILVDTFKYFIAGIAGGIAIAIGLAFGLALREPVAELFKPKRRRRRR
jgi:hypothetical protein